VTAGAPARGDGAACHGYLQQKRVCRHSKRVIGRIRVCRIDHLGTPLAVTSGPDERIHAALRRPRLEAFSIGQAAAAPLNTLDNLDPFYDRRHKEMSRHSGVCLAAKARAASIADPLGYQDVNVAILGIYSKRRGGRGCLMRASAQR